MVCALASLVLLAASPDWTASFPPAAVGTYLDRAHRDVVVAGAGSPASGAIEAAVALQNALRASGRARQVLDGSTLGDLSSATDADIAGRAANLPVDLTIVVRVLGAEGPAPRALATLRAKDGSLRGGFSAQLGTPLAPRSPWDAFHGVPQVAFDAMNQGRAKLQAVDGDRLAYDRRKLAFSTDPEPLGTRWQLPRRGTSGCRVGGAQFYEMVGRHDLATAFRVRRGVEATAISVGVAAAAAGSITLVAAGVAEADRSYAPATRERAFIAGGVTAGLGVASLVVGALMPVHTVDGKEARRLVDDYNRSLAREHGIPLQARLGGFVHENGGGLTLTLTR